MAMTDVPHETEAIAVRRAIAEKFPSAKDTEVHEHEGQFIGLTFAALDHGRLRHFYWADPTGAMPERPRYTREHAAAVLVARAERAAARITPGVLWTREGEKQESVVRSDAGDCTACGKQLADAWFRRPDAQPDPENSFPPPFDNSRFMMARHADGSPDHDAYFGPDAKTRCPECLRTGVTFQDTGYGWNANCPHCGWQRYTDSGD